MESSAQLGKAILGLSKIDSLTLGGLLFNDENPVIGSSSLYCGRSTTIRPVKFLLFLSFLLLFSLDWLTQREEGRSTEVV